MPTALILTQTLACCGLRWLLSLTCDQSGGNPRMAVGQVAKCTLAGSGSLVSGKCCHFPGLRFLPCKTRVLITTVPIAKRCFGEKINELLHPSAGS